MTNPPMPLRLYLIRHGETAWSLTGQHTGRTDILLTEQGEQDARELAERLQHSAGGSGIHRESLFLEKTTEDPL